MGLQVWSVALKFLDLDNSEALGSRLTETTGKTSLELDFPGARRRGAGRELKGWAGSVGTEALLNSFEDRHFLQMLPKRRGGKGWVAFRLSSEALLARREVSATRRC